LRRDRLAIDWEKLPHLQTWCRQGLSPARTKMAGIAPGHFHFTNGVPHLGGAMPAGGGGSEAVPPLSKGVMRRMVTRRLMRLGPLVCSFRYCLPYPCEVRFSAGTWNCCVSNSAADSARRSDSDRLSTSEPTASVCPSIRNTSRGLRE